MKQKNLKKLQAALFLSSLVLVSCGKKDSVSNATPDKAGDTNNTTTQPVVKPAAAAPKDINLACALEDGSCPEHVGLLVAQTTEGAISCNATLIEKKIAITTAKCAQAMDLSNARLFLRNKTVPAAEGEEAKEITTAYKVKLNGVGGSYSMSAPLAGDVQNFVQLELDKEAVSAPVVQKAQADKTKMDREIFSAEITGDGEAEITLTKCKSPEYTELSLTAKAPVLAGKDCEAEKAEGAAVLSDGNMVGLVVGAFSKDDIAGVGGKDTSAMASIDISCLVKDACQEVSERDQSLSTATSAKIGEQIEAEKEFLKQTHTVTQGKPSFEWNIVVMDAGIRIAPVCHLFDIVTGSGGSRVRKVNGSRVDNLTFQIAYEKLVYRLGVGELLQKELERVYLTASNAQGAQQTLRANTTVTVDVETWNENKKTLDFVFTPEDANDLGTLYSQDKDAYPLSKCGEQITE